VGTLFYQVPQKCPHGNHVVILGGFFECLALFIRQAVKINPILSDQFVRYRLRLRYPLLLGKPNKPLQIVLIVAQSQGRLLLRHL